jgi:hypothetical protein
MLKYYGDDYIHKSKPAIYIGFSPALYLQCVGSPIQFSYSSFIYTPISIDIPLITAYMLSLRELSIDKAVYRYDYIKLCMFVVVSVSHTSEQLELNYGLYKVIYFTAI